MSSTDSKDAVVASTSGSLAKGVLPLWGIFGVALGVLAPSTTLALAIGVVVGSVGGLTWLTWLLTTVIVVGFAGAMAWLAKRFNTTGGLYGLAGSAAGSTGGYFLVSTQLVAVLIGGPACALGAAIYLDAWLGSVSGVHGVGVVAIACVVVVGTNVVMALTGLKLAARVLLAIEGITVGFIIVLLVVVAVRAPGGIVDHTQFQFHGIGIQALLASAGFSVFSISGFEHAVTLGREAKDPRRGIPIALLGSVVVVGLVFVVASYVMVLGQHSVPSATGSTMLDTLAHHFGVGWLSSPIDLGVAVSFFGSSLAIMSGTSRTLFTLARDRVLPGAFASIGARHRTPRTAVLALGVLYLILAIGGALLAEPDDSYGVLGTLSGYLLIAAYVLTAVFAAVHAARTRSLGVAIVVSVTISVIGAALVYRASFDPFPDGAYRVVAWIFFAVLIAAVAAYLTLRLTAPAKLARIGATDRQADPNE